MIQINNWSSFQSYKDRKPPWIRFHKSLLDNFEYQCMSAEARALLPMLWLLASEDEDPTSGLIRDGLDKIAFRLRLSRQVVEDGVAECEANGFIEQKQSCNESVTGALQNRISTVTPETETETETEKNTPDNSAEQSDVWSDNFDESIVEFVRSFQEHVKQEMDKRAPAITETLIKSGTETVDKLIRIDGHTLDDVKDVLRWAVKDDFWQRNVLSIASLRKKSDGLTKFQKILAAKEDSARPRSGGRVPRDNNVFQDYECV